MAAAEDEQIPYSHEFVVNADYQLSLAHGVFAASFRRPWWWLLLAIFLLLVEGSLFSALPWLIPLFWIILTAALCAYGYLRTRHVIVKAFPVGKVLKTGFGADHFAITDGNDASVIAYSGFDDIDIRGDIVWLRRTNPKRRFAVPRALFADSDLDRIRAAMAKASSLNSADSPRPTPGTPA
jgi:hypothetical protein